MRITVYTSLLLASHHGSVKCAMSTLKSFQTARCTAFFFFSFLHFRLVPMVTFCAVKLWDPLRCASSCLGCLSCAWASTTRFSLKTLDVSSVLRKTWRNSYDDVLWCHRIPRLADFEHRSILYSKKHKMTPRHSCGFKTTIQACDFNAALLEGMKVRMSAGFTHDSYSQLVPRIYSVNYWL